MNVLDQDELGWMAWSYAPAVIRAHRGLVRKAVGQDPMAFKFAHEEVKRDVDFVRELAELDWRIVANMAEELRSNREILLVAVRQDLHALIHADMEMRNDVDFLTEVVDINPRSLAEVSQSLRDDSEVVRACVERNGQALAYAGNFKEDRSMLQTAMTAIHGTCTGQLWSTPYTAKALGIEEDESSTPRSHAAYTTRSSQGARTARSGSRVPQNNLGIKMAAWLNKEGAEIRRGMRGTDVSMLGISR